MVYLIFNLLYNPNLCDDNCDECIEVCVSHILKKDDEGLLVMLDGCECERCESCSMVCDTGALSVEWEDGDDLSMIKYIR